MTEDDSEASVGRREWLSVLGLGGALATVAGGSQPAQGAPVSDRLITLGPEDNPKGEIYEVGDDLVLEHSKTGATFTYNDTANQWVVSDDFKAPSVDIADDWALSSVDAAGVTRLLIEAFSGNENAEVLLRPIGSASEARLSLTDDTSDTNFSGLELQSATKEVINSFAEGTESAVNMVLQVDGTDVLELTTTPEILAYQDVDLQSNAIKNAGSVSTGSIDNGGNPISLGDALESDVADNTSLKTRIDSWHENLDDGGKVALYPRLDDFGGILVLVQAVSGSFGVLGIDDRGDQVHILAQNGSNITTTEGNGGTTNVYWNSGNSRFELNNESGGGRNYNIGGFVRRAV